MKIISLIFFLVALLTNPAISKIYEYKNYLEDNNIQPLVKSSEENSIDIIIDKKNIFMAKAKNDITKDILQIINTEIK